MRTVLPSDSEELRGEAVENSVGIVADAGVHG
jgi:hypothetical protein